MITHGNLGLLLPKAAVPHIQPAVAAGHRLSTTGTSAMSMASAYCAKGRSTLHVAGVFVDGTPAHMHSHALRQSHPSCRSGVVTHAHTRTHTHSHTHTHTHTRTHAHTHTRTHAHTHTRTHAHTHTRTHAHTHTRTHAHTHTRTHDTRTHAHTHTRTHARTHRVSCYIRGPVTAAGHKSHMQDDAKPS